MNRIYHDIAEAVCKRVSLKSLRNNSILITGSNGIIGSHIAAAVAYANTMLDLNARVTLVSKNTPRRWLAEVVKTRGFRFIQADLELPNEVNRLKDMEYQSIIHAATYGQPDKFLSKPNWYDGFEFTGTQSLLELAKSSHARFLCMSSSEVYGSLLQDTSRNTSILETDAPVCSVLDKRASYIISKLFSETLCIAYANQYGIPVSIGRISSASGPGFNLNDDRVLYVFMKRALESGKITLMDHGLQSRRWLSIEDAVTMLFSIHLHGKDKVYNISGSDMRSIGDIAKLIGKKMNVPVVFPEVQETASHTKGAPALIDVSNQKIIDEFSMHNLVPIETWLDTCIEWLHFFEGW